MAQHHEIADTSEYGTGKKTLKAYLIGFILCIFLTLLPFGLVFKHVFDNFGLYVSLTVLALMQLYVQVVYFLRLNANPKGRWNLVSFFFTILIILIVVFGSLWIMYNLNYNMMH